MKDRTPCILVVDDNEMQLSLIQHHLKALSQPYTIETASDGNTAWELLYKNSRRYDIVLLDRNMPGLHGIEVLTRMRKHYVLKDIPVILQTALTNPDEIIEGMSAGAYYYLTKPFTKELMLTIVRAALDDRNRYHLLHDALQKQNKSIKHLKQAMFEFKTIDEANNIAILLAKTCDNSNDIVNGLSELLVNAIEHGNLDLSYDEKSLLHEHGNWKSELDRRQNLPDYKNRVAQIEITRTSELVRFKITDQGNGFDWQPFMDFDAERMMDSHGRGIAVANKLCFSKVEYQGKGNIVSATVLLNPNK